MNIIGIDPGVHGALAVLTQTGQIAWDLPIVKDGKRFALNIGELDTELRAIVRPCHAFVEKVWSRSNEGAAGSFAFGRAYGTILGLLMALEIPHDLVTPAAWCRGLAAPKENDARRATAMRLFPSMSSQLSKKKDEHKADALLIAEYGRRKLGRLDV